MDPCRWVVGWFKKKSQINHHKYQQENTSTYARLGARITRKYLFYFVKKWDKIECLISKQKLDTRPWKYIAGAKFYQKSQNLIYICRKLFCFSFKIKCILTFWLIFFNQFFRDVWWKTHANVIIRVPDL